MKKVVQWLLVFVGLTMGKVLTKAAIEFARIEFGHKQYDTSDWSEKEYGPYKLKISSPFSVKEDAASRDVVLRNMSEDKQKLLLDTRVYTYKDEDAMAIGYSRYDSRVSIGLPGAIEKGYSTAAKNINRQSIPYTTEPRKIQGYDAIEASASVNYQGESFTINSIAVKVEQSIYIITYTYPTSPSYTDTSNKIFNSIKF